MSLAGGAADGLIGAIITAVPSYLLLRRSRPRRAQYEEAWKDQVTELKQLLAVERDANDKQYEQQIRYLKAQLQIRDTQIQVRDTEISRVQRLLGKAQRGTTTDD